MSLQESSLPLSPMLLSVLSQVLQLSQNFCTVQQKVPTLSESSLLHPEKSDVARSAKVQMNQVGFADLGARVAREFVIMSTIVLLW